MADGMRTAVRPTHPLGIRRLAVRVAAVGSPTLLCSLSDMPVVSEAVAERQPVSCQAEPGTPGGRLRAR